MKLIEKTGGNWGCIIEFHLRMETLMYELRDLMHAVLLFRIDQIGCISEGRNPTAWSRGLQVVLFAGQKARVPSEHANKHSSQSII